METTLIFLCIVEQRGKYSQECQDLDKSHSKALNEGRFHYLLMQELGYGCVECIKERGVDAFGEYRGDQIIRCGCSECRGHVQFCFIHAQRHARLAVLLDKELENSGNGSYHRGEITR